MDDPQSKICSSTQKALKIQLGEDAGTEISTLLRRMATQIDDLKRSKVSVINVVPSHDTRSDSVWNSLE
jgi:hypothetical protein